MSEKTHNTFREKLLSQEQPDRKLQRNFQLEAQKMYTENLKIRQRLMYGLSCFVIGIFTLFFWLMAKVFEQLQLTHGGALILGSVWAMYISIILLVLMLWPVIRGKVGFRFYPKIVRIFFCLLILAMAVMGSGIADLIRFEEDFQIPDPMSDILGAAITAILMIMISLYLLLSGRMDRADMQNKTKRLELEYRVAELEERLNKACDSCD